MYTILRWFALIQGFPAQLLFFKRKTYYEEGAPRKPWRRGGALIISNHFSLLDYMMNMFVVLPRRLNVVASEHAFRNRFVAFGMRFFGGIQADRITKDMRFMDDSADVIRKGHLVQIFPEGHNTDDGTIKPFSQSYIVIAYRAEAPIVPIVTDGNYGFFKRAHIIVGKPIHLSELITSTPDVRRTPTRAERESVNELIFNKILALRQELEDLKAQDKQARTR